VSRAAPTRDDEACRTAAMARFRRVRTRSSKSGSRLRRRDSVALFCVSDPAFWDTLVQHDPVARWRRSGQSVSAAGLGRASATCARGAGDGDRTPSVSRSVCGLVRTTTVLSRCDRGADENWRRQSSEYGPVKRAARIKGEQRDETASILDQRHARRLLPS